MSKLLFPIMIWVCTCQIRAILCVLDFSLVFAICPFVFKILSAFTRVSKPVRLFAVIKYYAEKWYVSRLVDFFIYDSSNTVYVESSNSGVERLKNTNHLRVFSTHVCITWNNDRMFFMLKWIQIGYLFLEKYMQYLRCNYCIFSAVSET